MTLALTLALTLTLGLPLTSDFSSPSLERLSHLDHVLVATLVKGLMQQREVTPLAFTRAALGPMARHTVRVRQEQLSPNPNSETGNEAGGAPEGRRRQLVGNARGAHRRGRRGGQ